MKTNFIYLIVLSLLTTTFLFAQNRTTVTANNSDISDNLDLRAVASIFGDSNSLEDFERRLNDPRTQISNLDLNRDNQVDYLRVIETIEGNTHLVVIQSVLGRDIFQDVATIEIERDRNNSIQVQVVGDVFMYGNNYIYEPVYAYNPIIYNTFFVPNYRPYCSSWYWGYYPSFFVAWAPCATFTYYNYINIHINHHHYYNIVNYRRCGLAYNNYFTGRRANGFERLYPNRSFIHRNSGFVNRYELDNNRNRNDRNSSIRNTRNDSANSNIRNNDAIAYSPRPTRSIKNTTLGNEYTTPSDHSNSSYSPRPTRNIKNTTNSDNYSLANDNSNSTYSPRPTRNIKNATIGNDYGTPTDNANSSYSPRPTRNIKSSTLSNAYGTSSDQSNNTYSPRPTRNVNNSSVSENYSTPRNNSNKSYYQRQNTYSENNDRTTTRSYNNTTTNSTPNTVTPRNSQRSEPVRSSTTNSVQRSYNQERTGNNRENRRS